MSIRYNQNQELRYLKYQNLLQESRILANYYRDQIHSYGVDCTYYKSQVNLPPQFSKVLSSNNILRQAYGYDPEINFDLSTDLITFQETETDIFTLDRMGNQNSQKTFFYFDLTEFATAFMTKLGQFKEYKMESQEISGQLNEHGQIEFTTPFTCNALSMSGEILCKANIELGGGLANVESGGAAEASNGAKPYNSFRRSYTSDARYNAAADYPKNDVAHCIVANHTDPIFSLPVNEYIARTFTYQAAPGDVATIAYFKYTLNADKTFTGTLAGTVLYYDLALASNYVQQIKPDVGDIIAVHTSWGDVLYDVNAIQDKDITAEGTNPLLFKYIWKISAQRHVDSYEIDSPVEEESEMIKDVLHRENQSRTEFNNVIEPYADGADKIYGGFTGQSEEAEDEDEEIIKWDSSKLFEGNYMNIITFGNGSQLLTDGLNLFFKNTEEKVTQLSIFKSKTPVKGIPTELRYLKATKDNIYFQNIDGDLLKLVGDEPAVANDLEQQYLNQIEQNGYNFDDGNFYKFTTSKSILFSSAFCLYAKVEDKDEFIHLA